jgi:hypothetical protein
MAGQRNTTNFFDVPTVNNAPDFSQFDLLGFLGSVGEGIGNFFNLPSTLFGVPSRDPTGELSDSLGLNSGVLRKQLQTAISDFSGTPGGVDLNQLQTLIGAADPNLIPALSDQFSRVTANQNAISTIQGLLGDSGSISDIVNKLNASFIDNDAISKEFLGKANKSTEANFGNQLIAALDAIESGGDPRKATGVRAGQETSARFQTGAAAGSEISGRNLEAEEFNAQKREEALNLRSGLSQQESVISGVLAELQKGQTSNFQTILELSAGLIDTDIANERIQEIASRQDIQTLIQNTLSTIDTLGGLFGTIKGSGGGGGGGGGGGFSTSIGVGAGDIAEIASLI